MATVATGYVSIGDAQVNLSGGKLTVTGNDGKWYRLIVDKDGNVVPVLECTDGKPRISAEFEMKRDKPEGLAVIIGERLFVHMAGGEVSPPQITLHALLSKVVMGRWQYYNSSGGWTDYPISGHNTTITDKELVICPTDNVFENNVISLRVLTSDADVRDITHIYKVSAGYGYKRRW